jgi:hypothetical protein
MRTTARHSEAKIKEIAIKRREAFARLIRTLDWSHKVVYIDEALFRPYSITAKSWSQKGDNHHLPKYGLQLPTVYIAVAISRDAGVEALVTSAKPIVRQDFL